MVLNLNVDAAEWLSLDPPTPLASARSRHVRTKVHSVLGAAASILKLPTLVSSTES
jgi:hypothetical protein